MNWGIVMYGGVAIFAATYYILWGRKTFHPPEDTFEHLFKKEFTIHTENEAGIHEGAGSEKDLEKEAVHEVQDGTSDL
jgi:hypothetical protein